MTLYQSLTLVRRRWTTVTAFALFALAVGASTAALQTPAYSATARVYFATRSSTSGPSATPADGSTTPSVFLITTTDLETYVDVMGSPLLEEAIREELALPESARFTLTAHVPGSSPSSTSPLPPLRRTSPPTSPTPAGPQLAAVAEQFSLPLARCRTDGRFESHHLGGRAGPPVLARRPAIPRVQPHARLGRRDRARQGQGDSERQDPRRGGPRRALDRSPARHGTLRRRPPARHEDPSLRPGCRGHPAPPGQPPDVRQPGAPDAVVITGITEDGTPVTSYSPSTFTPTSAGVSVTVLFTTGDSNTSNRTLVVTYTVGLPITTSVTVTGLATT